MAAKVKKPLVSILMGSQSDWGVMSHAAQKLDDLGIPWEAQAISAHRATDALMKYLATTEKRGIEVIIAGAGGAAALPGVCAAYSALPGRGFGAVRALAATVDAIWRATGDASTDFNYYTKRGLLAPVYSTTVLYWLADESEDFADTWAFLDRRIAEVMKIPAFTARLKKRLSSLPRPFDLLRRARG